MILPKTCMAKLALPFFQELESSVNISMKQVLILLRLVQIISHYVVLLSIDIRILKETRLVGLLNVVQVLLYHRYELVVFFLRLLNISFLRLGCLVCHLICRAG